MLSALCVASLTLNVNQAWRIRVLSQPQLAGLQRNVILLPFPANTLEGEPALVNLLGRKTIVYVLSPNCAWCNSNYNNIVSLAAKLQGRIRFVGIAHSTKPGDVKAYLLKYPMPFDTFVLASDELIGQLAFRATPTMLALDESGHIKEFWVGALMDSRKILAERYFGVTLPGVVNPPRD